MRRFAWVLLSVAGGLLSIQCVEGADLDGPVQAVGGSGAAEAGVPDSGESGGSGGAATGGGATTGGAAVTGGAASGGTPAGGGAPGGGGAPAGGGSSTGGSSTGGVGSSPIPVGSITASVVTTPACTETSQGSLNQMKLEVTISQTAFVPDISGMTVDYWYTPEIASPVIEIDTPPENQRNFTVTAKEDRIEIAFESGSTGVMPGTLVAITMRIHAADYQSYHDPSNDWSCGDSSKVTVRHNGVLISGTPPS